jgi:hypothetical protein
LVGWWWILLWWPLGFVLGSVDWLLAFSNIEP